MSITKSFRTWERKRSKRMRASETAKSIAGVHPTAFPDKTSVIAFARSLELIDAATMDMLPRFILNSSNSRDAASAVIATVNKGKSVPESLRLIMRHYDYLKGRSFPKYGSVSLWIRQKLVDDIKLHEWRLSEAKEREFIDLIVDLDLDGKTSATESWMVSFLIANPSKFERVKEILSKRKVSSLDALETLLDDDIPLPMQDGAL